MPNYDYCCAKCEHSFEVFHSIKDKPIVVCPSCHSKKTKKVPSVCGISIHRNSSEMRKAKDEFKKQGAMRLELKERYGLHTVTPLAGRTIKDVYADVRSRGGFVKEQMARTAEEGAVKSKAKQKEWKREAAKRAPEKIKILNKIRAEESAAKRSINVQTK